MGGGQEAFPGAGMAVSSASSVLDRIVSFITVPPDLIRSKPVGQPSQVLVLSGVLSLSDSCQPLTPAIACPIPPLPDFQLTALDASLAYSSSPSLGLMYKLPSVSANN